MPKEFVSTNPPSRLNRRQFVRQTLPVATSTLALAGMAGCGAGSKRPNILFILADDQSWPHASAYAGAPVRTPNFDRIAREGSLFKRAYTACPSCTPSRSAILAGRPIWQLGEAGVLYGAMPPGLPLFTHLLEDAGYHVGFTGKGWAPGNPSALGQTRNPCGKEFNSRQLQPPPRPGINPQDAAANFADFLGQRPSGAPFCFWFGSKEPHRIYEPGSGLRLGKQLSDAQVPPFLPDAEAVRSDLLDYYAEIEWFDAQIGRLLAELEKTGELDNTLILITSDNGMPFPRAKVNLYEAGVHMPLAIRWGARGEPGMQLDEFVSHIDLAPTILEAAGLPVPSVMLGRSLLSLVEGKKGAKRDQVFLALERHTMCRPNGATYPMRALRAEKFLYIRNYAPDRYPTGGEFLSSNHTTHGDVDAAPTKDYLLQNAAKHPTQYQLCFGLRPPQELYNVEEDPGQLRNLIDDPSHKNIVETMHGRLTSYMRLTKDPRADGQDPWQNYIYHQTDGYGAAFNLSLPEERRKAALQDPTHRPQ